MDVRSENYTDNFNASYWLALKFVPRLSIPKKRQLVKRFGIESLFTDSKFLQAMSLTAKQKQAVIKPDWQKINSILSAADKCHCQVISFEHPLYPEQLKQIYDPPLVLFVQGDAEILSCQQIAIVGSRAASITGKETASKFAEQLSLQKLVITSGLALGIDGAAHAGALKAHGKTIAVVATGLDMVYPARHKQLAKQICESGGVIVSEFVPGTTPKPGFFPKRNRIISALSLGVLVVEAELKSGSLITARTALEQNKEVFAIPSSIYNLQARGCHWLIKQGAKLVEECADIIEELAIEVHGSLNLPICSTSKEVENCTQCLSTDPLLASVGYEITPIDLVVSRCNLPTDVVLTQLTMLELKGLVTAVPGGYLRVNPID